MMTQENKTRLRKKAERLRERAICPSCKIVLDNVEPHSGIAPEFYHPWTPCVNSKKTFREGDLPAFKSKKNRRLEKQSLKLVKKIGKLIEKIRKQNG